MIEIYAHEFKLASETLAATMLSGDVQAGSAYYQAGVNAIIYTEGLLYNFHPKMEWPQRFQRI